ncbi:hypothetical protein [Ancylobacter rudongensis]|uniref:Uncharacterized protein n=1 Tax=Ancylobacter rudongensis TaxID=177413 RepID=A0A1G4UQU8_9HYPH|nr:hypothetical protein [Ancylobacter rudongensis]SCW95345.1 hypothetical protein SAMN05660859_0002 [Ancylobacter rudongensis]
MNAYYVLNGHTLGYINPAQPNVFGILHASVLRGSTFGRLDWFTITAPGVDRLEPATLADFDAFRVCPKGHLS